ncbi:hypothetical protein BJ085DRAFT_31224 [Dimargaris cristalligena]|uniref:Uncharacterized protein n=1 Tax=Dimargaris cristalligena TaxID=215637 RepID=A0A4V1J4D1_9FUNG|nr:hypothetical protein BJ085DRAFT_31224 [Dimargaris cristalligena]|eukprot:RKP35139.1 hypothetical protein BJ085DRAFT_31224 [Dimargaris cristalligena]
MPIAVLASKYSVGGKLDCARTAVGMVLGHMGDTADTLVCHPTVTMKVSTAIAIVAVVVVAVASLATVEAKPALVRRVDHAVHAIPLNLLITLCLTSRHPLILCDYPMDAVNCDFKCKPANMRRLSNKLTMQSPTHLSVDDAMIGHRIDIRDDNDIVVHWSKQVPSLLSMPFKLPPPSSLGASLPSTSPSSSSSSSSIT